MSDPRPGSARTYRIDDEWSRAVFGRRTGEVAAFLVAASAGGDATHRLRVRSRLDHRRPRPSAVAPGE